MNEQSNEYNIRTTGRRIFLRWYADTAKQAREEAEECGHTVVSVRLVKELRGLFIPRTIET